MRIRIVERAFRGHKGRPGKVGGSLPKGQEVPDETIWVSDIAKERMTAHGVSGKVVKSLTGAGENDRVRIQSSDYGDGTWSLFVDVGGENYYAERAIDFIGKKPTRVRNISIRVAEGARGSGLGTSIFYRQVMKCREMGINKIEAKCERSPDHNGYYTWARLGYDGEIENVELPEEWSDATTIHELFSIGGERAIKWWKENGDDFEGAFDTRPNSLSSQILEAYVKRKQSNLSLKD